MARNARKRQDRLVDMDSSEPQTLYRPPPPSACDVEDWPPIDIGGGYRINIRTNTYNGMYVDYSIQLDLVVGQRNRPIARIDTSHGEIHRHYFDAEGRKSDYETLNVIPGNGGWNFVHHSFDGSYAVVLSVVDDQIIQ